MNDDHVVVINDDPVQLRKVAGVLEGAGYTVSTFLDAAEALVPLSGQLEVDLFVVDLHMPGIDGWKLCRLLRSPDFARFNATPILVVSATFTGDDIASITHDLGADAFLETPFHADRLLDFVRRLLLGERPRTVSRVLIVEDDVAVRSVIARAFLGHGYEVLEAETVAQAERLRDEYRLDLLLVDYHLSDGPCDPLLDKLQGEHAPSVLVMTGDSDPMLPVRLLGLGVDGYLRKPFDSEFAVEMAAKVRRQHSLLRIESVLDARTRALRISEERYRSLFDTTPDMAFVLDGGGHVMEVNPEACIRLGFDASELVGRNILDVVAPGQVRAFIRWQDDITPQGAARLDTELVGSGGVLVPVEMSGRAVECGDGMSILMMGRDLTERRRAEEERRRLESRTQHAQRLESLGVLAGGVAHDFNNLLVGILGNASLALMDMPEHDSARESVHQIELAALRAAELTQQILTFSGRSQVATEPVHVSELIREMRQLLEPAVSKKARLSMHLPPTLPAVKGDPGQIRQVVMNLLMNASDALEGEPGAITLRAGVRHLKAGEPDDVVSGPSPAPGAYVFVEVVDTGCGMDQETLERIFEPFFTTKFTGRGLGLASTLGIVHAHGGVISVRSEPGRGTTVTVYLPSMESPDTVTSTTARSPVNWWAEGGKVLIVDDEPTVRDFARTALVRRGFTVEVAEDGVTALELMSDHPDDIDLVVMDVTMPELDGPEVVARMRDFMPGTPVLISSGYPPDGIVSSTPEGDATAFLRKPYTPSELMEAVSTLLRETERPREARIPDGTLSGGVTDG